VLHSAIASDPDDPGDRHSRRWVVLAAAALLIGFSILVRGLNHDEGQYVGAIALMRHGWPYIDFAYLQTPLQPLVLAPMSLIPAGWLLVAARIANGGFALGTIWLLGNALRGRARPGNILIALVALACTEPFLWGASLARNDALPMLLLAAAIAMLLRGLDGAKRIISLSAGGLLLGLAISSKISAAVPAAGALLFLLLRWRQFGLKAVLALGTGAVVGLLPCIILATIAPAQFRFDVFTYNLQAPAQWWSSVGRADMFEFHHRLFRLLRFAGEGIILIGLAAAAIDRRRSDDRLLLDLMVLGGAIGSYLPEPAYPQYLIPLLPPLVPRFALALDNLRDQWRRPVLMLTAVFCVLGLEYTAHLAVRAWKHGPGLIAALEQGRLAARIAAGRSIVALSPQVIAGADTNLDRRFVTGPFLYRTFGPLSGDALRLGYSPNWQRINEELDLRPPGAILVGGESRPHPGHPHGLDGALIPWAEAHGYKAVPLRPQGFTLFVHG
jgi:4-amino-4-deoxy-L-arabinose transferase-like glycosyltransferase